MNQSSTQEEYAEQIRRCAQALSLAKTDRVAGELASGHTLDMLKMFSDGNLEKRLDKLTDQFELMRDEFNGLEAVIVEYVTTIPLAAYDSGCLDAERFLKHLEATRPLTLEQQDFVMCQRGRFALEILAMEHRLEHVRFQELASLVETLAPEWGINPDLCVQWNPLHVWATFQTTVLLDEDDETPATVLFYPARGDIRTAVLEDDGFAVARLLESRRRTRWDDPAWEQIGLSHEDRVEICHDLAEIGLAAFG